MKLNNKKGNATVILVIVLLIALGIAGLFIKMNWRRFKAEASFGLTVAVIVIAILLILFILIKRSINKGGKERAQKKFEKEKAKLEKHLKESNVDMSRIYMTSSLENKTVVKLRSGIEKAL